MTSDFLKLSQLRIDLTPTLESPSFATGFSVPYIHNMSSPGNAQGLFWREVDNTGK